MPKRILTLDDLYTFYSKRNHSTHFSAKNPNEQIVVQIEGKMLFDKSSSPTEGLCPVHLQACHTLDNINETYIATTSMEKALPSLSNRPILGYIYKDKNGEYQFRDHAMHLDEHGEIVYDEFPIGIIPESCNAYLEYDEEKGKTYVNVNGYIFEEYSHAAEILMREVECSVSVELNIRELSYDAKEKLLVLDDFYFNGICILGRWENGQKVEPGMVGSNIKLAEFQAKNNKTFSQENVLSMLEEINKKIDQLNINNSQRKEDENQVNKFNELLAKYNVTAEDVTFAYDNMSDEELETAFAEAFEENGEGETTPATENDGENSVDNTEEGQSVATEGDTTSVEDTATDTFTKTFELSHSDIRTALYALLAPFETSDNDYYDIEAVYDDHFIYRGWCNADHLYSQKYVKNGDNIAFDGDRVHMNAEYLTDNELAKLNEMRSNYAKFEEVSAKLAKYENEPKKMEILESSDYANVANSEAFTKLKEMQNHFDLTVDELRNKCDAILLEYAKKTTFSAKATEGKVPTLPITSGRKTVSTIGRYGHTFDD